MSTRLHQLFARYKLEGSLVPDALEEFTRATIAEIIQKLPAEERLKGLPAEERLKGLSVEELLAALSPEKREALARRLKGNGSPSNQGGG
jgi:hypothetical protein